MNADQLITFIRDARIFKVRQLEVAAGLPAGTINKAIKGTRGLPDKAIPKILAVIDGLKK